MRRLSPAIDRHLAVSTGAALVIAVAVVAQAEVIARGLPELVRGEAQGASALVATLVVVALARAASAAVVERSAARTIRATRRSIRTEVLDHLERVRLDRRDELEPGHVAALTTSATDALEPWVRAYAPALLVAAIVPLTAGARILFDDLVSAAILVVVVPLIPLFMVLIGRATESQADRQWEALRRLSTRFVDVLSGMATLRLFGRADAQAERIRVVTDRYRRATLRTLRVAFLSALVLELLATLSVAIIAVSLGIRLIHGAIELETALLVLLLAPECLLPLRRVSAAFHASTAGSDAAREVADALAVPTRAEGEQPAPPDATLVVRGASVSDPERGRRLAPIDLEVVPGEVVAVTGPSGCGKTTLLDVVRGALLTDAGEVTVGGVPVGDLRAEARTSLIAWAPQHPRPLGDDVAGSVALGGDLDAEDERIAAIVRDLGLEHLAGRSPAEASGGERRRIGLARALLRAERGAGLLLADEPTAQLDAATSRRVVAALRRAAAGGTAVLVVTHDPTVAAAADRRVAIVGGTASRAPAPAEPAAPPRAPRPDAAPIPDPVVGGSSRADGAGRGPSSWRWVLSSARPHRARLIGAQALGVATEACTIALAATAAWLIVRAAEQPSFADLAVAAVGVRAFGLGKGVLRYAERLASHDATLHVLAEMRAQVVARLARLAPTGLPHGARGDLLARVVDDVDRLQDLFLRVIGPILATGIVALGAVGLAASLDPGAGGVLLLAVAIMGLALPFATHRFVRRRGRVVARSRGDLAAEVLRLAEDVEELAACGATIEARRQIEVRAARVESQERRTDRTVAALAAIGAAAPAAATAAIVAVVGAAGPGLSGPALGVLVLLPLAVMEMLGPLAATGETMARVEAAAERVRDLVERPDPVPEPDSPAPLPDRADVVLRNAAIAWPGEAPTVAGIDLDGREGQVVVVAGPSGSGKSTVAAALVRFLAPIAGEHLVGGVPAERLGGDGVRRLVTWCPQDPWFASSTLADNLRVARPEASDEELRNALDAVELGGWAASLPSGLGTELGRDAQTLSGGERQRLALARALLGGHRAIVFDEPTAHLDPTQAEAVRTSLLRATRDRAVILMGHDDAPWADPVATVRLARSGGGVDAPVPVPT